MASIRSSSTSEVSGARHSRTLTQFPRNQREPMHSLRSRKLHPGFCASSCHRDGGRRFNSSPLGSQGSSWFGSQRRRTRTTAASSPSSEAPPRPLGLGASSLGVNPTLETAVVIIPTLSRGPGSKTLVAVRQSVGTLIVQGADRGAISSHSTLGIEGSEVQPETRKASTNVKARGLISHTYAPNGARVPT